MQDGRLCGLVLAGSDSPPVAYMALIEDILKYISKCFPAPVVVELPANYLSNDSTGPPGRQGRTVEKIENELTPSVLPIAPNSEFLNETFLRENNTAPTVISLTEISCGQLHPTPSMSLPPETTRLKNILYYISCGVLFNTRSLSPERTREFQAPVGEVAHINPQPVRHYPRSPARARCERTLNTDHTARVSGQTRRWRLSDRGKRALEESVEMYDLPR